MLRNHLQIPGFEDNLVTDSRSWSVQANSVVAAYRGTLRTYEVANWGVADNNFIEANFRETGEVIDILAVANNTEGLVICYDDLGTIHLYNLELDQHFWKWNRTMSTETGLILKLTSGGLWMNSWCCAAFLDPADDDNENNLDSKMLSGFGSTSDILDMNFKIMTDPAFWPLETKGKGMAIALGDRGLAFCEDNDQKVTFVSINANGLDGGRPLRSLLS